MPISKEGCNLRGSIYQMESVIEWRASVIADARAKQREAKRQLAKLRRKLAIAERKEA